MELERARPVGGNVVVENAFNNTGLSAVEITGPADVTVVRNTVKGSKAGGIYVHDAEDGGGGGVIVEANVVSGCRLAGIEVKDSSPSVLGNTVSDNSSVGVLVRGRLSYPVLSRNKVLANGLAGLEVRERADPEVKENTIADNQGCGVHLHANGRGKLVRNSILRNKRGAVVDEVTSAASS